MLRNPITSMPRNHLVSMYKELTQVTEERIFKFDLKKWYQSVLEIATNVEFQEVIGVDPYKRTEERKNQRNGFYYRSLQTVLGLIKDLKIPRPRKGGFIPRVFQKYERREKVLNKLITECFWRGISTRDMTYIMKELSGVHISASCVTRLTKQWDREASRWHKRKLADDYVYLFLDGVWIKNRSAGMKKRLLLVAYGVKLNGQREIIDYQFACSESEGRWLKFLTNLRARGLEGAYLKLIISDGCKGLANAVDICYPEVDHQLCWAHKMRNILNYVRKADQKKVKKELTPIFTEEVDTKQKALKIIWKWCRKWRRIYPRAVKSLERNLDQLLYYLNAPKKHHVALRTSNHIERQFKEYRRRLRPMEILPNRESADRILYALTQIRNEKLREYPMNFTQNNLH